MPKKILIIDDQLYITRLLTFVLEKEGFECHTAQSGEEGLEKLIKIRPHAVILDVIMPTLDGYEVCRRIRNNPETKHTYVVMLTTLAGEENKNKGLSAGANEYITKPFSPSKVIAHLKEVLK